MSPPKMDRKIQLSNGKINTDSNSEIGSAEFARKIAEALHREFGETHAAVKKVVALTKANERAVKNWFSAKNGPTGRHLVDLIRSSDEVLEAVLRMSGRNDLIVAKKFGDSRRTLQKMLQLIRDL